MGHAVCRAEERNSPMIAERPFPWLPAGLATMLALGAAVSAPRLPVPPPPTGTAGRAPNFALIMPTSDPQLKARWREYWAVHGKAPLYQTAGGGRKTAADSSRTDEAALGAEFPPQLTQTAGKLARLQFPGLDPGPSDPFQARSLTDPPATAPLALGWTDPKIVPLAKRAGTVEVVAENGGQVVWSKDLPDTGGVPTGEDEWKPMEMYGTVSSVGLVGGLMVMHSSGSDKMDRYFSNRLVRGEQVGERLKPGSYIFRIAP